MTDTLIPADRRDEGRDRPPRASGRSCSSTATFRDAPGGGRFVTENPATGRPIAEVAQGGPADVDARGRGRAAGRRRRALVAPEPRRPQADPRPLGGPDRGQRARARDHRDASTPASRSPTPSASTCPRPRPASAGTPRPIDKLYGQVAPVARGHDRDDHPRAGRRRRRRHPVELPGPDGRLEARPGARDRQHGRDQARLDDVAQPAPDRGAGRRGRASRTACSTSSPGPGDTVGEAHRPPSRHRLRRVHGLDRGRPPLPRTTRPRRTSSACCSSSAARARSSCSPTPTDLAERRRQRRDRDLLEHGRELLGRVAADRPPLAQGRAARGRRARSSRTGRSATRSTRRPGSAR